MEELDDKPAAGFEPQQYLAMVKRRRWHILLPLVLGWLLVWGASWVLPSRYRSETMILVEQPKMPSNYVTPNVNDDLQARLQSITQQILSRTRLLHIIDELNLYPKERAHMAPDDLVDRMRQDVVVDLVRDESKRQVTAFTVSYASRDPRIAQQVTSELTNLFISENLEMRQQESEDTTQFLTTQLEDARKNLSEQEEKIRLFKDQHVGDLPGQLQTNLQITGGLQAQMQNEQDNLNRAKQQNVYYESLINQYRAMQSASPRVSPDGTTPQGLPALDQELEKLKNQLADLQSRYTDKHPDVRKVKDQIAQTEKLRAQMLADTKTQAPANDSANPASAAVMDPRQGEAIAQLQSQLKANQIEISSREKTIAGLQAKINDYQGRLSQEPVREQQLADLSRGYDQSKANYDDLLKKKNSSELATNLERRQQGEHFQILDPPSLPQKPDFPNHLKFAGAALGIGLALGIGVAGAAEFLDGRLYTEAAIKELIPVDILSEIPAIITPKEEKAELRGNRLAWAMTALAAVVILTGTAVSVLRG